jgi:hypothetical protein
MNFLNGLAKFYEKRETKVATVSIHTFFSDLLEN